ncbi:MAG: acetolactate synthase, large subunit, biosynthetic type, partial [Clostridia bacterium]|nr:acetolactate synthase, large subunit, biosynthetic type [Clostridia bacterium]
MINGAQMIIKCLEAEGVDTLFGYPGAAICPFYDKLYDSALRHVLVRHEQNAAHAANGYARASGKPGVCVVTSGPGALNLITGIATAYMDSIPIIAITGQINLEQLGRDVFQEADITGACESITKHSYLVKDARDLPRVFKEAFHVATTGRPGPVLIDIPVDVQQQELDI